MKEQTTLSEISTCGEERICATLAAISDARLSSDATLTSLAETGASSKSMDSPAPKKVSSSSNARLLHEATTGSIQW